MRRLSKSSEGRVRAAKASREPELTLADGRLDTFTIGYLKHSSVQKSLIARLALPSESKYWQQKLVVGNAQTVPVLGREGSCSASV